MQKFSHLLNTPATAPNDPLRALAAQAAKQAQLQEFWLHVAPKPLAMYSSAGVLNAGLLTIFAGNASAAAKIRLSSASLLTQLQNLQKNDPKFRECKVTAIMVKVQVKSDQRQVQKTLRKIPKAAEKPLRELATNIVNTSLSEHLLRLADKV